MSHYRTVNIVVLLFVLCILSGCAGSMTRTVNLYKSSVAEEKADEAYQNKDFATAFEEYKIAAQAGSPYGQFMVANMYLAGEGVQQDPTQYWYWIRQSAESGSPAANYLVGVGLLPSEPMAGIRYLEKAAALEHGGAMHMLGLAYASGIGVPKSNTEALKWFRLAQAQGIQVNEELLSEAGIQSYVEKMSVSAPPAPQRVRKASSAAGSGGVPTGQGLVREIQQRLTDLGYAPGPVDGMFGGKTRTAIQAFQREKGLQPDGKATPQLLEMLKSAGQ